MDAEDLSKAALNAIDDWLDEVIVGGESEHLRHASEQN